MTTRSFLFRGFYARSGKVYWTSNSFIHVCVVSAHTFCLSILVVSKMLLLITSFYFRCCIHKNPAMFWTIGAGLQIPMHKFLQSELKFHHFQIVPMLLLANTAAAAKSLQPCPTLCDPIDSSPPGSAVLGFSRQEHWSRLPFPSPSKY